MSDLWLSSQLDPSTIYTNQTAILVWLKGLGHAVEFVRDYEGAPLPKRVKAHPVVKKTSQIAKFVGKECPYCDEVMQETGKRRPTRDHLHPRSKGGNFTDRRNKLICCSECKSDKGSSTVEKFAARLAFNRDPRAARVAWIAHHLSNGVHPATLCVPVKLKKAPVPEF